MTGRTGKYATRSFFADSHLEPNAVRVCRGLSCDLHGSADIRSRLSADSVVADVYCLGYCHRSPALMDSKGNVHCDDDATQFTTTADLSDRVATKSPSIIAAKCEAVVTGRMQSGTVHEIARAIEVGVYSALAVALDQGPSATLECIVASGEQGRGGAGFPTGLKWRHCADASGQEKYVVANGDEGDPGSFADRLLMERDPHSIIEGLAICAFAIGACRGFVYIRSEYPLALQRFAAAVHSAREAGFLGANICDSGFTFDIEVISGQGSYVCGEETALLNAIEGRRGEVRIRPPYPIERGLFDQPTVVNNVETLVNVPWIVNHGADAYRKLGTTSSPGTKVFSLNAGFSRPGLIEVEFGTSIRQLVDLAGGASHADNDIAYLALGGPMGSILPPEKWDVSLDFPVLVDAGIRLGHGGLIAIPDDSSLANILAERLRFMAVESCGKCIPCSDGSERALSIAEELVTSGTNGSREKILECLLEYIRDASLCAFGREIAKPALTLLKLVQHATSDGKSV